MSTASEIRALSRFRQVQLAALVLLLAGIGAIAFQIKLCVLDPDIWWHLKVGDWIIDHFAAPTDNLLEAEVRCEKPGLPGLHGQVTHQQRHLLRHQWMPLAHYRSRRRQ